MIDLRSDTVTRPSADMLKAMFSAKVGDDVLGDDPTVNELEKRVASLFGKEAALFFPSGTMANQVAIQSWVRPGDEVICDQTAHIYRYEGGGIAANSGASVRLLDGYRGQFTATDVEQNINADDPHFPKTTLVCAENTVNKGGGACWNIGQLQEIAAVAQKHQLPFHLDGARLWNAMSAQKHSASDFGTIFDSISVCFSKGLGCPVGSVLTGSKDFIYRANRLRKRMGGGMRQSGYLAAACLYALDHNIDRLEMDHVAAHETGKLLEKLPSVEGIMSPETNIVLFKVKNAETALHAIEQLRTNGILASATGGGWIRFVFHMDVSSSQMVDLHKLLVKIL